MAEWAQPVVSQHSIAERAGVSRAAVSIVLGDPETRRVSVAVKQRILAACAELGYSGDARGRRRRICVTLDPAFGALEPYFSRFMAGAGPVAEEAGYALVLKELPRRTSARSLLVNLNCDGILAFGAIRPALARELDKHLPVVVLNQPEDDNGCDTVTFDEQAGVAQLVHLLVEQGHRRIAYLATGVCTPGDAGARPAMPSPRLARRLGGYLGTAATLGLPIDDALIAIGSKAGELGLRPEAFIEDALAHLLALGDPPTAIIAYNDVIAASVYTHLRERGLRVPEDLSLVGFDAAPPVPGLELTTIDSRLDEVGRQAVACLLARLSGTASRPPLKILATPSLVTGASVAPRAAAAATP